MKEQWKRLDSDAKLFINVEEGGRTLPVKIEIPASGYNNGNQIDCYKRLLILLRIFVLVSIIFLCCSAVTWYAKNYRQFTLESNSDKPPHHHHQHHHDTPQANAEVSKLSLVEKVYDVSREQENDNSNLNKIQITPVSDYKVSKDDIQTERTVDINTSSEKSSESDRDESDSVIVEAPTELPVDQLDSDESENYYVESDEKELWGKLEDFLNLLKYAQNPFLSKKLPVDKILFDGAQGTDSEDKTNFIEKKFLQITALDHLVPSPASSEESDENKNILEPKRNNSETDEDESTSINEADLEEFINALLLESQTSDSASSNSEEIKKDMNGLESTSENVEDSSDEPSKASEEQKEEISETTTSSESEEIKEKNDMLKEVDSEDHNESENNESTLPEQENADSDEKNVDDNLKSEEKNENSDEEIKEKSDESSVTPDGDASEEKNNNSEVTPSLIDEQEAVSDENESSIEKETNSDETDDLKMLSNVDENKYMDVSAKLSHLIQDPLDLLVWYYQNKNNPDFESDNEKLKVNAAKLLFSSNILEFNDDLNTVFYDLKDVSYEEKEVLSSLNLYYILNRLLFKVSLMNQHDLSTDKIRAALEYSNALDLKAADEVQQHQQTLLQMMRNVGNIEEWNSDDDELKTENTDKLESTLDSQEIQEQNSESIVTDNTGDNYENNSNSEQSENEKETEKENLEVTDNVSEEEPMIKEKLENDEVFPEHQLYEQYEDYYDY